MQNNVFSCLLCKNDRINLIYILLSRCLYLQENHNDFNGNGTATTTTISSSEPPTTKRTVDDMVSPWLVSDITTTTSKTPIVRKTVITTQL